MIRHFNFEVPEQYFRLLVGYVIGNPVDLIPVSGQSDTTWAVLARKYNPINQVWTNSILARSNSKHCAGATLLSANLAAIVGDDDSGFCGDCIRGVCCRNLTARVANDSCWRNPTGP